MKNDKLMIFLIAVFAALPPFAIDTYAPAVPSIAHYFSVENSATMLTYTTYFIGYSLGLVVWGAMSDIFGRKKILAIGVILYIVSTIVCSLSEVFWQLSTARMFQGFGDAACTTVAFAILRDCYDGKKFTKAMASVGMVMMFAPIVAPIIGATIIDYTGKWQWIFHFLTAYGVFLLLCSFITPETNFSRYKLNSIYSNYKAHLSNKKFMILSIATGLSFGALFSFIGSSAIVYISLYHATRLDYALLFAINATAIIAANFILKRMIDKTSLFKIQVVSISSAVVVISCGLILVSIFASNFVLYIILMWWVTFLLAMSSNSMMSEAMLNIKQAFGIATSISMVIKSMLAGIANYALTLFTYKHLNVIVLTQQLIIILIIALLYMYSRKVKSNITT